MFTELYTQELRHSARWLNRVGKIPVPRTGWNRPENWLRFEQLHDPRCASLVIGAPFIAVDLDWKKEVVGSFVEDLEKKQRALNLIEKYLPATYVERSLSGLGVHLFYTCDQHDKLPSSATINFEVYARDRQFAMTGNKVENAPNQVTRLPLDEARRLFSLAGHVENVAAESSTDEGYWCDDALRALLEAYREFIPGFEFQVGHKGFMVPCPANGDGWSDGTKHSFKDPRLSRFCEVFIRDGWPKFWCFHAHCVPKTFNDFRRHHDPDGLLFNFDDWDTAQMERINALGGGR